MPKQIKNQGLDKQEKTNRCIGAFTMVAAFAMGGVLLALMKSLDGSTDPSGVMGVAGFVTYAIFLILTLVHFINGIIVWKKKENYGVLFPSLGSGVSAFSAIVNIRFELALFFSSIGSEETAQKVIGNIGFETFMAGQRSAWSLMLFGMALSMMVGLAAMVRLLKN